MADELMVTAQDTAAAGLCARGVRAWLEAMGWSRREFLTSGIPAARVEACGDHQAMLALAAARRRAAGAD